MRTAAVEIGILQFVIDMPSIGFHGKRNPVRAQVPVGLFSVQTCNAQYLVARNYRLARRNCAEVHHSNSLSFPFCIFIIIPNTSNSLWRKARPSSRPPTPA